MTRLIKNKKLYQLGLILLILFSIPSSTHAAGDVAQGIANASNPLTWIYFYVFAFSYFILQVSVQALAYLAQALNWVIRFKIDTNLPVVETSWKIIRNFSNMFFIVVMIITAFATIFNFARGYYWRDLVFRFIAAALLINFSLVIGQLIISGTQTINSVFIYAIGDMSLHIGQVLDPSALLANNEGFLSDKTAKNISHVAGWLSGTLGGNSDTKSVTEAIAYTGAKMDTLTFFVVLRVLFSTVLVIMVIFSLLVAFIFSLVRIPIIWLLLILSPLAWLTYILPATRNLNKKWWDYFLGWNLFLPIFLFVLYFGLYFLSQYNQVITSLSNTVGRQALTDPLSTGFSIEYLLAYILVALIFIFGTSMAISGGFWGSSGVLKAAGWARESAWRIPGFSHLRAVGGGVGEAARSGYEKTMQEGLFGYGGQQALERLRAGTAGTLGVRGRVEAQLKNEVKYYKEQYDRENRSPEELRNIIRTEKSASRRLAAYEVLRDKKDIEPDELYEAYRLYGENTISATDFAMKIDFEKDFDRGERAEWYNKVTSVDVKKKIAKAIATQGEFRSIEDMKTAAELFRIAGVDDEKQGKMRDFLRKASEKNIIDAYTLAAQYKLLTKYDPVTKTEEKIDFEEALKGEIGRKKGNDFFTFIAPDLYNSASGKLKTNDEIRADPRLKSKAEELIKLRNLVQERLKNDRSLLDKLKRNPNSTTTQSETLMAFDEAIKSSTSSPPGTGGAGPSSHTISAEINENNIID